jgi:hypothetical protein
MDVPQWGSTLKPHPDKEQEDMRFEQQVALVTGVGNGVPSEAGLARVRPFLQASAPSWIAAPEELAAAIAFLASKDASYIHGAILPVDGGWFAA